jgi:hypothetical protein
MYEGLNSQTVPSPLEDIMLKSKLFYFENLLLYVKLLCLGCFFCHFNLSHKLVFQTLSVSTKIELSHQEGELTFI